MMFSHALVVALLAIALWALGRADLSARGHGAGVQGHIQAGGENRAWGWLQESRWELLAGQACGWALACEYTVGIAVAGLVAWVAAQRWRRAVPFCMAVVPPLLLVPGYSWLCFRNPFILPYALNASFPAMKEGLYAIKWPNPETGSNLLLSPARGLLFWTPFLAMAGFGYTRLARRHPAVFWLTYAVPLVQIIVLSGRTWDWPAGPTLGPRYLAPILPFLALPCALGAQRFPRVGILLAGYSIVITTLATLTNACPPFNDHPNPLFDFHIPLLLKGQLAPNLGTVCGLPPWLSVVVYYAILIGGIYWLWRHLPAEPARDGGTVPAAPAPVEHVT